MFDDKKYLPWKATKHLKKHAESRKAKFYVFCKGK